MERYIEWALAARIYRFVPRKSTCFPFSEQEFDHQILSTGLRRYDYPKVYCRARRCCPRLSASFM